MYSHKSFFSYLNKEIKIHITTSISTNDSYFKLINLPKIFSIRLLRSKIKLTKGITNFIKAILKL